MIFSKRLAEQVAVAFAIGFLSVFSLTDLSTARSALIAGAAAAAKLIYGLLVKQVGDTDSPSIT